MEKSFLYSLCLKVEFSMCIGLPSPSIDSTTKSFTTLKFAFEGVKRKSLGLIISTYSLYNALNKISNDLSVPLLK